jgi:hypothetical protein
MATYLQGVNDYISQVQPTAPNLAFDAQILQTKQAKYDANHKKVSELYGSLLNSSMTRTENVQARDEFFKIINDDIQRMGSMDFSLDQNVDSAASVFQSIYNNKNIVKDMVWTRDFNDQVQRGEAFKNCLDPKKCGGQWWEEGDKYLAYKRLEFKNASAAEAMSMDTPQYVPYNNVAAKAIEIAKEAGLSMKYDQVKGNYIYTTKNGEQLVSPLTQLFNQTIGQNPQFAQMYQAKAYVDRKDWVYNKINTGEFADENAASVGYFKAKNDIVQEKLQKAADDLDVDYGSLTEKYDYLKEQYEAGKIKEGSDEYRQLMGLPELIQSAESAKQYTEMLTRANENATNATGLRALGDINDQRAAFEYLTNDIDKAARTLALKDAEVTMEADDFAKMAQQHSYNVSLEQMKFNNDMAKEKWKLDNGLYNDKVNGGANSGFKIKDQVAFENKNLEVENMKPKVSAALKFKQKYPDSVTINSETGDVKWEDIQDPKLKARYKEILKDEIDAKIAAKSDSNKLAIKAGQSPKYTDVLSVNDISASDVPESVGTGLIQRLYDKRNSTITDDKWNAAINELDATKPIYYQLQQKGIIK